MNTKQIRQKILDLVIRGELVPQDPTDEPASVLLERIRAEKEQLIKDKKLKRDKKDNEPIDEVPFELPEGWEWCRLGEIIILLSGQDLNYKECNETQQGIPYIIGASNFHNGRLNINRWTEFGKNIAEKGEILVTCKGTVGEMSILEIDKAHIARQIMSIKAILCYQKYILYFLSFRIKDLKEKANGLIPGISREDLLYQLIPLPPLAEQHRIAQKVEQLLAIVDTIEQLQEELKALVKQTKNQVLNYAIAGKLTHQDPNDEPAEALLKRIGKTTAADTPYEKLPKGWAWCRLEDIANISMGQSPKGETVTKNSNGIEFHQGKIYFTDKYINKSPFFTSEPTKTTSNSVLLCVRAPVGEVNLVNREVCIGRGLCAIEPLGNISIDFCFFWLILLKDYFNKNSTGSTFSSISGEIIRNAFIPLPPLAEQHRIVEKIETFFASFDQIEKELT
jgi:type I site-specific deoxyribonuclease